MKGRIFIAWSGSSELAHEVKKQLESKNYIGVVGGDSKTELGLFVGDVVLRELNQCNQAIFLVEKKNDGMVSANLMFELGYSLSEFEPNKNHIFYIDISRKNTKQIPSDLEGLWAKELSSSDYATKEELASVIVKEFLSNQKVIVPEEKMEIINSYYAEREKLSQYSLIPHCSEYELAQYVLFFSQAAYLFSDEKEAISKLKKLLNELKEPIKELRCAIKYGITHLNMLCSIKQDSDVLYLDRDIAANIIEELQNRIAEVERKNITTDDDDDDDDDDIFEIWEDNDFTKWLRLFINSSLNYAYTLAASCKEHTATQKITQFKKSIQYGENALTLCEELKSDKKNKHVIRLQRAYINRNMATDYKALENSEKEVLHLKKSFNARQKLLSHYKVYNISNKIFEKFELEYFIAASERLEHISDENDYDECKEKCADYVKRTKKHQKAKNFFVDKIEKLLFSAENEE